MNTIVRRLITFRRQIIALWRAFLLPTTPIYLKAMMVGVLVYILSPFDIIPDFLIGLGWIDDFVLVAFAVNWIFNQLPSEANNWNHQNSDYAEPVREPAGEGPIIEGKINRRS